MKLPSRLLVLCLCGAGGAARADLTIVQKIEAIGQTTENTIYYHEGKTRVDFADGGGSMIVDAKSGETLNLIHGQKTFLRMSNAVVKAAVESVKPPPAKGEPPVLKPTGQTETIAGYPAAEYEYSVDGAKVDLWLTHDLPDYAEVMKELTAAYTQGPLATVGQTPALDVAHLPGFPLRIINEAGPGTSITVTVESVSLKPVALDLFAAPADYHEMKSPVLTPPAAAQAPSLAP